MNEYRSLAVRGALNMLLIVVVFVAFICTFS